MTVVEHRKCRKCGKVAHITEFQSADTLGHECLNQEECKNKIEHQMTSHGQIDSLKKTETQPIQLGLMDAI